MSTSSEVKKGTREPYEAPTVEEMSIRPEESMLLSCKSRVGGSGQQSFNSCTVVATCRKS